MLNIGRMAPGRADYYLTVVADRDDATDYYLAPGEEPGRWLTTGGLALGGTVRAEQLRAVLDARHPDTGEQLASHPARKVPGFDLTYRPPKSVSLLWALGDRNVAAQVVAAHDAAVAAAVGYLEREAGLSRRGAGGAESVKVDGFIAAAFRHRTSRADDPLLHTHVLIANLAKTSDDGVWRTLDSRRLYAHAKTAGVLYQAQLRWELTLRLGVAWQPVVHGVADLAGVDRPLIEAFSTRRTAIVERLAARGESSAKAAQVATLTTRQSKGVRLAEVDLRARWRREAQPLGVDDDWHRRLLARASPRTPDPAGIAEELIDREGLTAQASTFTRRELLQAVAERLPTGLPVLTVERLADRVLAHNPDQLVELGITRGQLTALDVIRRADGRLVAADPGGRRYTTRGLLLLEQHAITTALARSNDGVARVDEADLDRILRRRTLSDEQAVMVRRLTTSGAGVEVVVGKAGTGKTYALDAARHAWSTAGIEVSGVALAARAALELQDTAGIPSTTLASVLHRLDSSDDVLPSGSVLVVDEAGMVGTRQLARLMNHAADARVKVVLVGDPHQLPELDAGGLYRALTTRLPAIELTDNRRQHHVWEQAALDELRHGDPTAALDSYRTHGRIITADTPDDLRERLVDDWWDTARHDPTGSIMIGLRRADVDDLNHRARARLHTARRLTGPTLHDGGTELQAGDRIVCLRNHRGLGVVNGTRATITHLDPQRRQIVAITDDGRPILLDRRYLDAGHVTHGYAITGHKAQGLTVEHTYVLGSEALYREWGYVALSRGRQTNRLYQTDLDQHLDEIHTHVHQPDDPHAALAARMARTRAQQPVTPELAEVAEQWRHLHALLHEPDIARARTLTARRATLARHRQAELEQLDRLQRRIDHATAGLGRITNRHMISDLRHEHDARTAALDRLDRQLRQADAGLARLPEPAYLGQLQRWYAALTQRLRDVATSHLVRHADDAPAYLTAALGPRPSDASARRWDHAAGALGAYRLRWSITDPDRTFGTRPADPLQHEDVRQVLQTIGEARRALVQERHRPGQVTSRRRSLGR
jgi:conjugative relaxase-like TrwC/TraI family protein